MMFSVFVVYPENKIIGTKIMGAISIAILTSVTTVPIKIPKSVASQERSTVPSIKRKKFAAGL